MNFTFILDTSEKLVNRRIRNLARYKQLRAEGKHADEIKYDDSKEEDSGRESEDSKEEDKGDDEEEINDEEELDDEELAKELDLDLQSDGEDDTKSIDFGFTNPDQRYIADTIKRVAYDELPGDSDKQTRLRAILVEIETR